jgi:hypothetical protein
MAGSKKDEKTLRSPRGCLSLFELFDALYYLTSVTEKDRKTLRSPRGCLSLFELFDALYYLTSVTEKDRKKKKGQEIRTVV